MLHLNVSVILLLFLSSCTYSKKVAENPFESKVLNYCRIILKDKKTIPCRTIWVNKKTGEKDTWPNAKEYIVQTGEYTLNGIKGGTNNFFSNDYFNVSNIENLVNIVIPEGKSIYIGHIELDIGKSLFVAKAIKISDKFDLIQNDILNDNNYIKIIATLNDILE